MIKSVKGMRDLLPPETFFWGRVEEIARAIFGSYGYEEIRTPVAEETQLFVRGIGEGTDIVHKEMYTFPDRKGRSLTLRPEMTAGVVRSFIENGFQQRPLPVRLWYLGPMFRYERPQKGRYRQFHQVGAEIFGSAGPEGDAEMIAAIFAFLRRLHFHGLTLRLNSVGDAACRPAYVEKLREVARGSASRLCSDCVRRAEANPLRIFDCKVEGCRMAAREFPLPAAFLCEPCRIHAGRLAEILAALDLPAETDERLVRGLDYYTRTVFEITAGGLGSQDAIVGGGRYDRLVSDLGGPDIPAVGFAAGLDRIIEILPQEFKSEEIAGREDRVMVVPIGREAFVYAFHVAEEVREAGLDATLEIQGRSPKASLSRAVKEHFRYAILAGEKERDAGTVVLKDLTASTERELPLSELAATIAEEGMERFLASHAAIEADPRDRSESNGEEWIGKGEDDGGGEWH